MIIPEKLKCKTSKSVDRVREKGGFTYLSITSKTVHDAAVGIFSSEAKVGVSKKMVNVMTSFGISPEAGDHSHALLFAERED